MKKIIAFLSVLVMMIAMSATVSFAADNEVAFNTKVDGTTVTIDVSMNTTYTDINEAAIYLDMAAAYDQGATITVANGKATLSANAAQKMVIFAFKPLDGSKYVSGDVLGTITVTGVSKDFAIALKPASTRTTTKIVSAAGGTITDSFGTIGTTIKMVEATADYYAATLTWGEKAKANTGVKFNFSDSTDNKNKYAKVPFGDVTFEADSDVTVAVEVKNAPAGALTFTGAEWYLD